jgi:hypothetical protein
MEDSLTKSITAVIKTFERPKPCLDLLNSVRYYYPHLPIIVGDDSKQLSQKIKDFPDIEYLRLPYDIGVCAGRNRLVESVRTKYTLLLEDDFIFSKETRIIHLLEVIEKGFDLVGGIAGKRSLAGVMSVENGVLATKTGNHGLFEGYPLFDMIHNFFLAKTSVLKAHPWNEARKIGEHEEWFFTNKGSMKITEVPNVTVEHIRQRPADYQLFRQRAYQCFADFMREQKLVAIVNIRGVTRDLAYYDKMAAQNDKELAKLQ